MEKGWEKIDSKSARLKVPEGWVVRYREQADSGHYDGANSCAVSTSLIFISDKEHSWVI